MGISKVEYDNEILMDVSNDTITAENLAEGLTAHNSNGDQITGTFPIGEVDTQSALISQIKSTLANKVISGGSSSGSGLVDVVNFLPTSGIDERAVYRVSYETNCFIKIGSNVYALEEFLQSNGVQIVPIYYEVDELPTEMVESDLETKLHIYIVRDSDATDFGVAYFNLLGEVTTVGQWGFGGGFDKGVTEDVYSETATGVYTTVISDKRYFIRDDSEWTELVSKNSGGEEVSDLFIATCDVDLTTMQVSNISHSSEEMINAHNSGKTVKVMCNAQLSGALATLIANPIAILDSMNTIILNGLFHSGGNLMYLQLMVYGSNGMLTPLAIPTTSASGVSLNE